MMVDLKELSDKPKRLVSGIRTCAGCGIPQIVRKVLAATDNPVVVGCATGCLEVTSTIYPFSSWNVPFIHNTFENISATMSGVERAHKALVKQGKANKDIKFVAFGGDGGSYDIGLQSLSGALERGHDFVYVCYDNEAYMNTGVQRSSATPYGAATTTSPAGKVIQGKEEFRKNLTKIAAAHNIKYVGQSAVHNWQDVYNKAKKAFEVEGPAFMCVLQPCTLGWRYPPSMTIEISRLAVETNFWPLYEVIDGEYKLNYKPKERVPVEEYMKPQGRFKHLFKPENKHMIEKIQAHVDSEWDKLLKLCGEK